MTAEGAVLTRRSGVGVFRVTERTSEPQRQPASIEPERQQLVVAWGDPGPAKKMLGMVLGEVLPATGVKFDLVGFDLSVRGRQKDPDVVRNTGTMMSEIGSGVKSATIGPEDPESQGLPNANIELRRATAATAIVRSVRPIPGVTSGEWGGFTVVRYADDSAMEDTLGPESDQTVIRTEYLSARRSRQVAEYALELANKLKNPGQNMEPEDVVVRYGSRAANMSQTYSIFDAEVASARLHHAHVPFERMTFDKFYETLPHPDARHIIIPALEEPGDGLSNLVLGLMRVPPGTVPSMTLALDVDRPRVVWTDTIHGTAHKLQGQNKANPMATVLAVADVLRSMDKNPKAQFAGYTMRRAVGTVIADGVRTRDLGGRASTTEFIDALKSEVAV